MSRRDDAKEVLSLMDGDDDVVVVVVAGMVG